VTAATSRASPIRESAVRFDVDVEDRVAVQLGETHPDGGVGRQDQDPIGVAGQVQLIARAEHAVAEDAHLFGPLDVPPAGQDRSGKGHRDALPGGDVRRAAHDRERLAVADPDARH